MPARMPAPSPPALRAMAIPGASMASRRGSPTRGSRTTTSSSRGPAKDPGTKGLSAFIVDADTPGLDASERIDVIAPHPLGTLRFTECRVAADRLLGQPGEGFKIAMATLDVFRSTVGAAALGFARRAFDEATLWALKRRIFGRALSEFQLTQAKLADMAVSVDAAALLVYRAGVDARCRRRRASRARPRSRSSSPPNRRSRSSTRQCRSSAGWAWCAG